MQVFFPPRVHYTALWNSAFQLPLLMGVSLAALFDQVSIWGIIYVLQMLSHHRSFLFPVLLGAVNDSASSNPYGITFLPWKLGVYFCLLSFNFVHEMTPLVHRIESECHRKIGQDKKKHNTNLISIPSPLIILIFITYKISVWGLSNLF